MRRLRAAALAMITVMASLASGSLAEPPDAQAQPAQRKIVSYNIQGARFGSNSDKWNIAINNLSEQNDIVMVQEAGPHPPLSGVHQGTIEWDPSLPRNLGTVEHRRWTGGTNNVTRQVYFLQTDTRDDGYRGRVNSALVTREEPDEVAVVRNPIDNARPALGVLLGNQWYFTIHALAGQHGRDAAPLLEAINGHVAEYNRVESANTQWTVGGDFNRDPRDLTTPYHLIATGRVTHVGNEANRELDYFATNVPPNPVDTAVVLNGRDSDHFPVQLTQHIPAVLPAPSQPMNVSIPVGDSLTAGDIGSADGFGYLSPLEVQAMNFPTTIVSRDVPGAGAQPVGARIEPSAKQGIRQPGGDQPLPNQGGGQGGDQPLPNQGGGQSEHTQPMRLPLTFAGTQQNDNPQGWGHEAYGNLEIDQIAKRVDRTVPRIRKALITLMAGTYDMKNNTDPKGAPERLNRLIDQLVEDGGGASVIVATLPPVADPLVQKRIEKFNAEVRKLVGERVRRNEAVELADMRDLTTADLSKDGLHPNESGYDKIAKAFVAGIDRA